MNKFTLGLGMSFSLLFCMILMAFSRGEFLDEQSDYIQNMLVEHHDSDQGAEQISRYQLNVTNTGFCRYRRYYASGKIEYFSFNLSKFKGLDYSGTDEHGELYLRTTGENVIVQTYKDKKAEDVDSMSTYMIIPVKNILAQDVVDLSDRLLKMNAQLLAQK